MLISGVGTDDRSDVRKYGTAYDLPSVRETQKLLRGLKFWTLFIARDRRKEIVQAEQEVERIADVMDRFYERLGPRNWIFHDTLSLSGVESFLNETEEPEDSERRLVELYRDEQSLRIKLLRLRSVDGWSERFHMIERARKHYESDEFDSCVLHLIAVMDGFVNDFDPGKRKGLASREPDTMVAWDSMVGHHMGLTNVLKTFTKTVKKRKDDPVVEIYRHGIVHGMVLRFDNVIVATKAWNMLFAVADWAEATKRSRTPAPEKPTFRETLQRLAENRRVRRELDRWSPASCTRSDKGFENHELHERTNTFLSAWRDSNFGRMATLASHRIAKGKSKQRLAGELREDFDSCDLVEFEVTELENRAPAIWLTRGTAVMNGKHGLFECRWTLEDEDGGPGFGSASSEWRLVFCDSRVWRPGK